MRKFVRLLVAAGVAALVASVSYPVAAYDLPEKLTESQKRFIEGPPQSLQGRRTEGVVRHRNLPSSMFAQNVWLGGVEIVQDERIGIVQLYRKSDQVREFPVGIFYKSDRYEAFGRCMKTKLIGCFVSLFDYEQNTIREYHVYIEQALKTETYDRLEELE